MGVGGAGAGGGGGGGGRALLHTDSSAASSRGLMYSNPSNSDWSILLMTSLQVETYGGGGGGGVRRHQHEHLLSVIFVRRKKNDKVPIWMRGCWKLTGIQRVGVKGAVRNISQEARRDCALRVQGATLALVSVHT